jgi:tungstate transport system ATP-binding protein
MLYRLTGIRQRYNDKTVLCIDHLEIEAGRIHALLGPNGAGKTTLLRLLAFLDTPTDGLLQFSGRDVRYSRAELLHLRRQVVLVDQHPIMFSTTAAGNVEFGLKVRNIPGPARRRAIDEALETVGLLRYKQAPAQELSGGETQRLALARALALKPAVLLCDEPTASVDVENQAIIGALLQQINTDHGTTILFTTHDRVQATSLAQKTLMLENGRPVQTSRENRYTCTLTTDTNGTLQYNLHGRVSLPVSAGETIYPTTTAGQVYIDPEKITLSRHEVQQACGSQVIGTIVLIMAENSKIRIVVHIGVVLVVLMDRTTYEQQRPAVGETVTLHFAADTITFLEQEKQRP